MPQPWIWRSCIDAAPLLSRSIAATPANHALAGLAGQLVGELLTGDALRRVLGASFLTARRRRAP